MADNLDVRIRISGWAAAAAFVAMLSGATVATAPAPARADVPGLVMAYSFDAGSGATVADASGNGNTGTVNGAAWDPAGRFGKALEFDGVDDNVRVASSASLSLSTGMTLAAWIKPTAAQGGWRCVVQKEPDAYLLNASNPNGDLFPSGGGTFGGGFSWTSGTAASPVNAWTHLALTYDGAMLRLYVNGVQAATNATSGGIQNNDSPLWIGGNSPYGENFEGLIDEVRIYNRALSSAELNSVMLEPIGSPGPDTTPPSVPANLTAYAVASDRIDLAWTASTDDVGVTAYGVERCFNAGCTDFAEIARPSGTSFSHNGIAPSQTVRYRVRAFDAAGNAGGYSAIATATTPPGGGGGGGFPTAATTGVPPGTTLTTHQGHLIIDTPGVYEGLDVTGCVEINVDNVTIRRSRVGSAGGCPYYVIKSFNRHDILIEDVEIVLTGWETVGIAFDGYTARRVKFSPDPNGEGADCAHTGVNVVIEDSYCVLSPGGPLDGPHYDGFQSDGGDNITIRHNTIKNPYPQTSAILMSTNSAPISNVTIDNNLLAGGGWTVYCGTVVGPVGGSFVFTNNRFTREFFPEGGYAGPAAYCTGLGSGNVWDDTGTPINT